MYRRVAEICDFVDAAKLLQNFGADRGRLDLATAGFQVVHDFIHQLLERQQTGRTFFEKLFAILPASFRRSNGSWVRSRLITRKSERSISS